MATNAPGLRLTFGDKTNQYEILTNVRLIGTERVLMIRNASKHFVAVEEPKWQKMNLDQATTYFQIAEACPSHDR